MAKNRESIKLVVQDDGAGFELGSAIVDNPVRSLGLAGMREGRSNGGNTAH